MHSNPSPPNDLEAAVLEHLAQDTPALRPMIGDLVVQRRELTGAGSYTYFEPVAPVAVPDKAFVLGTTISVPGPPNGLGAALFMRAGCPVYLEVFTIGIESWNGDISGFSIDPGA